MSLEASFITLLALLFLAGSAYGIWRGLFLLSRRFGWQGVLLFSVGLFMVCMVIGMDVLGFASVLPLLFLYPFLSLISLALAGMWLRRTSGMVAVSLLVLAISPWVAVAASFHVNSLMERESKVRGDRIVEALEHWKAGVGQGKYPGELDVLVPGWFKELPEPAMGLLISRHWGYCRKLDGEAFSLEFPSTVGRICAYHSVQSQDSWRCTD